ncbi:MAG: MmcQ/YjbR family DNA-binding protein [Candidatus Saccharimonadales bacterium]
MTDQQTIHEYLLSYPNVWVDQVVGDGALLYKIGTDQQPDDPFFAVIVDGSKPVKLSVRCDPQLAQLLRDTYESVLPGQNVNKKSWNTILCTGQVGDDELQDFIRLSYQLAQTS